MAKKGPPGKESGERPKDRSPDPSGTGEDGPRTFGKRAAPLAKDGLKFSMENNTPAPARRWGWACGCSDGAARPCSPPWPRRSRWCWGWSD